MRCAIFLVVASFFRLVAQPAGVSDARYAHLARGVNMSGWFDNGYVLSVGPSDVNLLKNAGFTCIRLPVAPEDLLAHWASASTIATNLANLDTAIDMFLNAGMAVMLDFAAGAEYDSYYLATPSAAAHQIAWNPWFHWRKQPRLHPHPIHASAAERYKIPRSKLARATDCKRAADGDILTVKPRKEHLKYMKTELSAIAFLKK
jgi:hypothetical protein